MPTLQAQVETWECTRWQPGPELRPYVASFTGYRQAGGLAGQHRGLPSPYLTFIVTLDEPMVIAAPSDPNQAPDAYRSLIGGLHTTPTLIAHAGRQAGIQLALEPLGVRALLGVPAAELANIDVHAADVLGPLANELLERVQLASSWPARFAILASVLQRRLDRDRRVVDDVVGAWRLLSRSHGRISIAALSDELGWSSRYVSQRLHAETGLTPKSAARVMRFDRARRQLQARVAAGLTPGLADLAAQCGYYDQAHLTREFREMAGCSPGLWIAEEFRNIQALGDEPLAD